MIPANDSPVLEIHVLVVDDEPAVLDGYRAILDAPPPSGTALQELRGRLFAGSGPVAGATTVPGRQFRFTATYVRCAEEAVEAVRLAIAAGRPFEVIFLDMRMPPGKDGVWAAEQIRGLDREVSIVLSTAYSDLDPAAVTSRVPPEERLFYLQKPFHVHEVRQFAVALGCAWEARRRIHRLAYYDTLTGLPNRASLKGALATAIGLARRHRRSAALLYLDLDNFKRINDTLGHGVGDELIRAVADILRSSLRATDHVARSQPEPVPAQRTGDENIGRLGGDEFMVLLPEIAAPTDAGLVAERLLQALARPVALGPYEVLVTASIGIAVYAGDHEPDEVDLLKDADLAMYYAKRSGPNTFAYYDASMSTASLRRMKIETLLRRAVDEGQLSLQYQPLVNLETGRVSGLEALIRWNCPGVGHISPLEFIPVAEETGMIVAIDEWVLGTACRQAAAWEKEGVPFGRVAVNVSPMNFTQQGFAAKVRRALEESGLAPGRLELEITENVLLRDEQRAVNTLNSLKAEGASIAIDDFGTGYSTLNRLKQFPVDRLKIDRSFIRGTPGNANDRAIASAIISMAGSLGLMVVAEGVEESPQMDFLNEQRCDEAQGFLLSRPLVAEQVGPFLSTLAGVVAPRRLKAAG